MKSFSEPSIGFNRSAEPSNRSEKVDPSSASMSHGHEVVVQPDSERKPEGIIFDIARYAIHDGPGIRTIVFFKGCPLRCFWCDNPESQHRFQEFMFWPDRCIVCGACEKSCPTGAVRLHKQSRGVKKDPCRLCGTCVEECYAEAIQMVGRPMSVQAAMAEIEKDRDFYDESGGGVTFSGGEALSQPEFLYELLCGCSEAGIHTAVETCGHIPWPTFERVVPLVDLFLFDLKMMDPIIHEKFTGITNKRILTNLKRLSAISELIIRVPLIPGINDSPENIRSMGEFLGHLPGRHLIHLLPYHRLGAPKYERLNRPYPAEVIPPPAPERVERVRAELQGHGFEVVIGG